MTIASTALTLVGCVLLAHATYSSYELSLLAPTKTPVASSSGVKPESPAIDVYSLPPDIVIETLLSTGLLLLGIVLGSPKLRPIEWAPWAGEIEKDMRRPKGKKLFEGDGGAEGGGMAWLEDRKGFWDVRGKRKEFADWVRSGGNGGQT